MGPECDINKVKKLLKMMERASGVQWMLRRTPETISLTHTEVTV